MSWTICIFWLRVCNFEFSSTRLSRNSFSCGLPLLAIALKSEGLRWSSCSLPSDDRPKTLSDVSFRWFLMLSSAFFPSGLKWAYKRPLIPGLLSCLWPCDIHGSTILWGLSISLKQLSSIVIILAVASSFKGWYLLTYFLSSFKFKILFLLPFSQNISSYYQNQNH